MTQSTGPKTLYFALSPGGEDGAGEVVVVMDPAWTAVRDPSAARALPVRDAIGRVLATADPIATVSSLLDDWSEATGVVERLTMHDVSLWYLVRLRTWEWLQERVVWAWVVRSLIEEHRPTVLACDAGVARPVLDVIRLIAESDGLALEERRTDAQSTLSSRATAPSTPRHELSRVAARLRRQVLRVLTTRLGPGGADPGSAEAGMTAAGRPASWDGFVASASSDWGLSRPAGSSS